MVFNLSCFVDICLKLKEIFGLISIQPGMLKIIWIVLHFVVFQIIKVGKPRPEPYVGRGCI